MEEKKLSQKTDPNHSKPMSHGPLSNVEPNEQSKVGSSSGSAKKASSNMGVDVNSK